MSSLLQDIKAAGVPHNFDLTDLYFKSTVESQRILARHPSDKQVATTFRDDRLMGDGSLWVQVPFRKPITSSST